MHIVSVGNEKIKFVASLKQKKFRQQFGLFVLEGEKLVSEAISCAIEVVQLFVLEEKAESFSEILKRCDCERFFVSKPCMEKMSETETPQGILAVVKKPERSVTLGKRVLLLENIQDPANVGALLRTAVATGFDSAVLVSCCDPFSAKAIRSSMSGIFRVSIIETDFDGAFELLKDHMVLCGDMGGENVFEISVATPLAVAVGNEGNGVSEALKARANRVVSIPMEEGMESLNVAVAGSLLMYQMSRFK